MTNPTLSTSSDPHDARCLIQPVPPAPPLAPTAPLDPAMPKAPAEPDVPAEPVIPAQPVAPPEPSPPVPPTQAAPWAPTAVVPRHPSARAVPTSSPGNMAAWTAIVLIVLVIVGIATLLWRP